MTKLFRVDGMAQDGHAFRCPKCGSSWFGSGFDSHTKEITSRSCHDEYKIGCRWRYDYKKNEGFESIPPKPIDLKLLKSLFDAAHLKMEMAREQIYELQTLCTHDFGNSKVNAKCTICKQDFGWYCPNSPDHTCYYYSDEGLIELKDGSKVTVPSNHDSRWETDDCCIFCHQPDERK